MPLAQKRIGRPNRTAADAQAAPDKAPSPANGATVTAWRHRLKRRNIMEFRFATPADKQDLLDFINLIFSQTSRPHRFERLLPKAYAENVERSDIHAVAVCDGRIRGCVGVYPFTLTVAGEPLKVGYMGSVSVHPSARGQGVMKRLMSMQLQRARETGLDMLLLGGQRQRYEYYGFEPCGAAYHYEVTQANLRHCWSDLDVGGLSFEPLASADYAYELYGAQPVTGARTREGFIAACQSFGGQPWLIRRDGKEAGYLIASGEGRGLTELVLEEEAFIPGVVKAWMEKNDRRDLSIRVAPHDEPLNRALAAFAEGYSIAADGAMNCLNPSKVIGAYLRLKNRLSPLSDGVLRLGIRGAEAFEIAVEDGRVRIASPSGPLDAELDGLQATRLAFDYNRFGAPRVACPSDWFPLPQSLPIADTF